MDKDKSLKKERETLIEDKLKKILFGSKGSTIKDDRSSQGREFESISDNYHSKENDDDKNENLESNNKLSNDLNNKFEDENKNDKYDDQIEDTLNLITTFGNNQQVNNSVSFNDKFSFADKVTFESEKFKNEEVVIDFNKYIKTETENETINNDNLSIYSKKILKTSNGLKKKDSSFISDKQINDSVMSDKTLQSNQISIQELMPSTNIKDIVKNNTISNNNENHYLHIIEYKLQINKENNKLGNFQTNNNDIEKTRNDLEKNNLNSMSGNSNSFQISTSLNSSAMNSTINTQKKESINITQEKNRTTGNSSMTTTTNTSSNIPKKSNNSSNNTSNTKIKISNKNFDSNKNDLYKYLSNTKKDENKYKDIKSYINSTKPKADICKSSANVSKDEIDIVDNKKIFHNCKSKDKKKTTINKESKSQEKQQVVSVDKAPISKHVKTSSVCSVKNLKNSEILLKYEPLSQRSSSNTNTSISGNNINTNTTNIKKIKIDNININLNDDKKKFESHIKDIKNINFYKEKYLKSREKIVKANEVILKLSTKLKIEELKNKVKTEKTNCNESFQQLYEKTKKNQAAEINDITCEKMETFLNNMNIKHTETVSNMLNIFKSNRNINDAFIGELCNLMKNDKRYLSVFETFGKTINQLLLTNLNIRENDLKIIQSQQTIIDNYENNQNETNELNQNQLLAVSKDKDDYDTIQLMDVSSMNDEI